MPYRILSLKCPIKLLSCSSLESSLPPKEFGCIHVPKSDPNALKCILVFAQNQKGYKCYNPSTQKRNVSIDVTFHETVSFYSLRQPRRYGEDSWLLLFPFLCMFFM